MFGWIFNHLQPLWRVSKSFPAFLSPHIPPQLSHPFPNPRSHFQPLPPISTCFSPISTALESFNEPTHVYNHRQPFSMLIIYFRAHIPPCPHFEPFPLFFHLLLHVFKCLQLLSTTNEHLDASPSLHMRFQDWLHFFIFIFHTFLFFIYFSEHYSPSNSFATHEW